MGRLLVALSLSLTFTGAHVLAAACLMACAQPGVATSSVSHEHHHAPAPPAHDRPAGRDCGHDHNGIAVVAAADSPSNRLLVSISALATLEQVFDGSASTIARQLPESTAPFLTASQPVRISSSHLAFPRSQQL